MLKSYRKAMVFLLIVSLALIPFGSAALAQEYFEAREPGGGAMVFDFLMVRPIGIIATAVGSVFWVVSLPFSALGDNVDEATEKLIKEPAKYTFKRPLGEF